ncbi:unnamed protein product [Gongylonema pulchrum]|uniref:Uncharacterized protein n=1 Tax=Gongylonema pulchrum TaxID=637853 RepID=A0A183DYM0_9BILA|nr:unnamed protein product [Gongylonema pulchrum]
MINESASPDLRHELEHEKTESPKPNEHVVFDDKLNEVHEIGSDIDIVVEPQRHELEHEKTESPKPNEHVVFDDKLNEVHEIGSDIDIVVEPQVTVVHFL